MHDTPFRKVIWTGLNRLPEIYLDFRGAGRGHEKAGTEISEIDIDKIGQDLRQHHGFQGGLL